ncbi:hypothetical protein [Acetilactobacillus jinshanensis]|uniref:Uncharacterized protein n=1 Tax=Acetilactobacillus jinshanensis TaxID=1720083 RepID=A0A4P6ZLL4_9LACO|nr:hypothetical protein [Acetilactobacillus jinshanensis]QBP18706.1 hypothetical protein ELX58_06110 [Acetilactobacillus jinshanensis]URL61580.1 hypothetical protein HGK75_06260 [uncultured bacterium]
MKHWRMWLALAVVVIVISALVIWTQNHSAKPWILILVWAFVIIILQLMFIYLIVVKNHK